MAGEVVLVEPLNGGLVTARDPSTLRPGELQRCDNTIYRPNDQAIFKAPGRNKYNPGLATLPNVTFPSPIKGIRALSFDNLTNPWLIAYYDTSYVYSEFDNETESVTFGSISSTIGDGSTLDSVHYNNKHYLLNGAAATDSTPLEGGNHCVKELLPATGINVRRHGLAPVVSFPDPTKNIGGPVGSWPDTTDYPIGWYFFLITEVHDANGPDELESAFEGTPRGVRITANTEYVTINLPSTLVNDGSESGTGTALINKIRVYMSTMQSTTAAEPPVPSLEQFFQIAEVPWTPSGTVVIQGDGTAYGVKLPTLAANISGWSNKDNVLTDNNLGASATSSTSNMVAYAFGFTGVTGTLKGIEVEIKYKEYITSLPSAPGTPGLSVGLTQTANTTNTLIGEYKRTFANAAYDYRINVIGNPADLWAQTSLTTANITAAAFGVLIKEDITGHTANVDYVKVKLYTGVMQAGKPYPVISIVVGDILITESANSQPPVAETGDVFESQMVLNDITRRAIVRYSLPDAVEYFPKDYYIQFSSKEQDRVTHIRRLGNKLIVGLKHQLFRVNYLPRQLDAEFDRGRAVEAISETHGIIGTQAACLYSPPDKPQLLAYVSSQGIHTTDGYQTTTLSEDLNWTDLVEQAYLHQCVLVNYPKLYSLVLYYTPVGATTNTRSLWFNYHPSHVKEGGKLLVSGPNDVTAKSSCMVRRNNEWTMLTGHTTNGLIYVEDREYDDEMLLDPDVYIITRDIYPVGIGYEATIERLWVRHYAYTPILPATIHIYYKNTESIATLPTEWGEDTFTNERLTLSRLDTAHVMGESFQLHITFDDQGATGNAGLGISYIAMEAHGHGLQDNPGG